MATKIFLKASDADALGRAVKHFRTCNYFVEVGQGGTFSALIPSAHGAPIAHIIRDYGLKPISEEEFKGLVPDRRELALLGVQKQRKELEAKMTQEQQVRRCVCGYTVPISTSIAIHKMHCKQWRDYIQQHADEIVHDAVEKTRRASINKWGVANETITVLMVQKGLVKFEETSSSFQKSYSHKFGKAIGKPGPKPAPKPLDEAVIPEAVTAIWKLEKRAKDLEKENTELKAILAKVREVLK